MSSKSEMDPFVALGIVTALVPISILFRGLVIMKVWAWHMVTVFESLPVISASQAISVSIVTSALTYQFIDDSKDDHDRSARVIVKIFLGIILNAVILLQAWVIHLFQI